MLKDLLFYSSYCDFCTSILDYITKKNLKHEFMLVCVDNDRYRLPEFVDRVPLIFTRTKHVLVDQSIQDYLQEITPTVRDIEPFSLAQGTGNYSDMFSFLDSADEGVTKGYTYLGAEQQISYIPEEGDKNAKNKFDSSVLERYMAERDSDIKKIIGQGNPMLRIWKILKDIHLVRW